MADGEFEGWAEDEILRIQAGVSLRRPSDHQSMFKYVSLANEASWEHLENTLNEQALYGSSARSLNDPFEQSPCIFDDLNYGVVAEAISYHDSSWMEGKEAPALSEVFADLEPYRRQARSYLDGVAERFRSISFCERSDSGLLWSHYANSYMGACLQFLPKGFGRHRSVTLGYVTYSKCRPTYPLSLALSLSKPLNGPAIPMNATSMRRAENDKLLFFTKSEDWSYEAETRIVYDTEKIAKITFKKEGLASIIVGPRMSEESRARLRSILEKSAFSRLPIRIASLSKTTFSVEIDGGEAWQTVSNGALP